jgi:hypothetical protein
LSGGFWYKQFGKHRFFPCFKYTSNITVTDAFNCLVTIIYILTIQVPYQTISAREIDKKASRPISWRNIVVYIYVSSITLVFWNCIFPFIKVYNWCFPLSFCCIAYNFVCMTVGIIAVWCTLSAQMGSELCRCSFVSSLCGGIKAGIWYKPCHKLPRAPPPP